MKKIIAILLVGLFMIIAFNMPEFYGSESYNISGQVCQVFRDFMISKNLEVYDLKTLNFLLRKLLHFGMYTLFTVIAIMLIKKMYKRWWLAFMTGPALVVCIALGDEKLQTLVPGRSGKLFDVLLDCVGIAFGLLVVLIVAVMEEGPSKRGGSNASNSKYQ